MADNTSLSNGRYQLQDRIGQGGMGDVYRAIDTETDTTVAVKQLQAQAVLTDAHSVMRFQREAEALRRLNHPNIVKILDSVQEGDRHYIIMEYVAGGSLQEMIKADAPLPIETVTAIALELADALTRAHHLEIIHRDIKPANVLVAADGTPRLTDFGVARVEGAAQITQTGALMGTYAYLAPEIYRGQRPTVQTDLWSLGVVVYEMLTGRRPFGHDQLAATMAAILSKPVPDLAEYRSGIPEALIQLVHNMLAKEPTERISSARLVGAQLEAIISGTSLMSPTGRRFDTPPAHGRTAPLLGPRHNLPPQPTRFVGRDEEVAEIVDTLRDPDCRLLTLVGPGGMGKTRLAIQSALEAVGDFRHGVRFVPLAAVAATDYIPTAVAESLGIQFSGGGDLVDQIVNYLRQKEMLLVLDNFEHLLPEDKGRLDPADLLPTLLGAAPGLRILATSREVLNLWEEWTRPVRGMAYPTTADDADAAEYSAVRLFVSRAKRVQRGFQLEPALPHIIEICGLVQGMPLAIELAASWLKMLPVEQIVLEVRRGFDFLSTSMRGITARHRSMRAVFDYSWQLLTEDEKRVFAALSVFQGDFGRMAAEAVTGASLLTLSNLVNKSLLYEEEPLSAEHTPSSSGITPRYSMHELLKQYAADRLAAEPEVKTAVEYAHADYYLRLVWRMEPLLQGGDQIMALDLLRGEIENIRAAWSWTATHLEETEMHGRLHEAMWGMAILYEYAGWFTEGRQRFTELVTAVDAHSGPDDTASAEATRLWAHLTTRVHLHAGVFSFRVRLATMDPNDIFRPVARLRELSADERYSAVERREIGRDLAFGLMYVNVTNLRRTNSSEQLRHDREEMMTLTREVGDEWLLVRALNVEAINSYDNLPEQMRLYREGLQNARRVGDEMMVARFLHNLSQAVPSAAEAEELLQEGLALVQEGSGMAEVARFYFALSQSIFRQGDFRRARNYLERALAIQTEVGMRFWVAVAQMNMGHFAWAMGDEADAEKWYQESLDTVRELGSVEQTMIHVRRLGEFYALIGREVEAKTLLREGEALLTQVTADRDRAELHDKLGNLALTLRAYEEAGKHFDRAADYFTVESDSRGVAWAHYNRGIIAYQLGRLDTAVAELHRALTLLEEAGDVALNLAQIHGVLGEVYSARDEIETAEQHLRRPLALPHHDYTVLVKLQAIVDFCRLLVRRKRKAEALKYLLTVMASAYYQPYTIPQRNRQRAQRMKDTLEGYLPADEVQAAQAWAAEHDYQQVCEHLLAGMEEE